jgi:hypothetical protein
MAARQQSRQRQRASGHPYQQQSTPPPPPVRDNLNALDFGAKGDCFSNPTRPAWQVCSDDGPALQAAIDAAQLQRRALFVPAGSYGINSSLIIHSDANASDGYKFGPLRMIGAGKALTSISAMKPGLLAVLDLPMVKDKPPMYAFPHEGVEIEHIGLSAAGLADYCFHAPAIARSTLSNIYATGARKVAILMAYG